MTPYKTWPPREVKTFKRFAWVPMFVEQRGEDEVHVRQMGMWFVKWECVWLGWYQETRHYGPFEQFTDMGWPDRGSVEKFFGWHLFRRERCEGPESIRQKLRSIFEPLRLINIMKVTDRNG